MTQQKNQRAILKAANEIKSHPEADDIHFLIAGSGPLEDELKTAAADLGVEDLVTFTGYLPQREQIYSLLHQSDIFLVPSEYEGFCVAAVEAMACRSVVIASDIEVLREVVGEAGIFVSTEETQELGEQIIRTVSRLGTEQMQERRGELHRRAVTKFPLERTAVEYGELYSMISN
jgi:glycosyltransferase involved in cell wall biosynthesis